MLSDTPAVVTSAWMDDEDDEDDGGGDGSDDGEDARAEKEEEEGAAAAATAAPTVHYEEEHDSVFKNYRMLAKSVDLGLKAPKNRTKHGTMELFMEKALKHTRPAARL